MAAEDEDTTVEELPEGQDTFDRAYVEKLRAEAAKYRTQLRRFEQGFGTFNESEQEFLFEMIQALDEDLATGAQRWRDWTKEVLQDKFYEGLTDLPTAEVEAEEPESKLTKKKEDQVSLTKEEMAALLAERDEQAKKEAEAAAAKAAEEAAVEEVFREVEEAGFERGSEGFMVALSLAQTQASLGKDVDFKDLAPKVRQVVGMPDPAPEGEAEAGEAAEAGQAGADGVSAAVESVVEGTGKAHAVTAGVGGSGTAGESKKDWIQEAKDAGRDPMEVARERLEARLGA